MRIVEQQHLVLGSPGCGKTTRLLNILDEELAAGVPPQKIAYVSFTKQAVSEASSRVHERFGYAAQDLPYFRTLHSLCYRLQSLSRTNVMSKAHYEEVGAALGYNLATHQPNPEDGFPVTGDEGNRLLFVFNLARNRRVSVEQQWHDLNDYDIDLFALRRLDAEMRAYKREHDLLDYSDMLEQAVIQNLRVPVEVAIIDEAQDLSTLQWAVCQALFAGTKRVYIAGDDDQAIYRWAGADVESFLALTGTREVLGKSYRLPRAVYDVAQRLVSRIQHRFEKAWKPRDDAGEVLNLPHIEVLEFDLPGTWMILARNGYQLSETEMLLRQHGVLFQQRDGTRSVNQEHFNAIKTWERLRKGQEVPGSAVKLVYKFLRPATGVKRGFKGKGTLELVDERLYKMEDLRRDHGLIAEGIWHDALDGIGLAVREYYLTALRAGRRLSDAPRVRIGTIHSVKGGEADNVALMTDLSWRTFQGYQTCPDDEHRVFYVGATRAKKRLCIIDAKSPQAFSI
ncbi:UvrD-helicase domain-containing protein [Immundisolibacter sp.]